MPDLYVSALGVPFRAVIAHAGGERAFVRLSDRPDDDFCLNPAVWVDPLGAATGSAAVMLDRAGHPGHFRRVRLGASESTDEDVAPWTARDLLAVVLRRLLTAAEAQYGESIQRVVCVVPADASASERSECTQAATLAGAQLVELVSPAGADVIVEAWDDITRLTLAQADGEPRIADLSSSLSRGVVRGIFLKSTRLDGASRDGQALADQLFDAWANGKDLTHGITATHPVARGAPASAHAPASVFTALDAALRTRLADALAAAAVDVRSVRSIDVVGSWTQPFGRALRALAGAQTIVRDDRGLELDRAIHALPPQARTAKPSLTTDVFAVAESTRQLRALAQGEPIRLLSAGTRLPATSISENFKSDSFIGSFRIAARSGGATTPLINVAIPRYAERQANSYLRAVVHADTPDLMFLEVAYLYSTRRVFVFVDKRHGTETPVSDHVFRVVRA